MQNERFGYIDCCRGILAILIIVFHIWGIFNGFVSSFTVGAFFVLSGWVSNADHYSVADFVRKRIRTLLFPYFVVNTLYYVAFWFLKSICLEMVCPSVIEEGTNLLQYWVNVLDFPSNGGWFTASWFVWVLFWVVVIDKAAKTIFRGKSVWVYWCILAGLNVVVQRTVINVESPWRAYGDLVVIGALFYNCGIILKKTAVLDKLYTDVNTFIMTGVGVTILVGYIIYLKNPSLAVDWPRRQFENIFVNLLYTLVWFGIVLTIARMISERNKGNVLEHLGRVAMPVMLLQFSVFQIFQIFEIAVGIKDKSILPAFSIATYSKWDWAFYTFITCWIIIKIDNICRKSKLYRVCICGEK